jgi:hypothetical protein
MVIANRTGNPLMDPCRYVFYRRFWRLHLFIDQRFESEMMSYAQALHPQLTTAAGDRSPRKYAPQLDRADLSSNAVGYAKFRSRSHDAVIRVYDETGNVIETHEHAGEFREW